VAKKKTTKKKTASANRKQTTSKSTGKKAAASGRKKSTKKKTTRKSTAGTAGSTGGKATGKKTKKKITRKTTKKTVKKKTAKNTSKKKTTAGKKAGGKKKKTTAGGKSITGKQTGKKAGSVKTGSKKKTTRGKQTTRSVKRKPRKSTTPATRADQPPVEAGPNSDEASRKAAVLRKISDTAKREASEKDLSPEEIRAKAAAAIIPEAAPKKLKSPLSKRELKAFAERLLEKRAELVGDLTSMEAGALLGKDSANLSNMPQHMADIGSDNYEQELTLGLMESERRMLIEIDEALARVNAGTFGVCEATGEPISKARLDAKPWAKYSIEAARAMERGPRF